MRLWRLVPIQARIALVAAVIAALVGAVFAYGQNQYNRGYTDAEAEALRESARRVAKGAAGAQQAREAQEQGRSPEEGVRSRDGRWR